MSEENIEPRASGGGSEPTPAPQAPPQQSPTPERPVFPEHMLMIEACNSEPPPPDIITGTDDGG